MIGQGIERAVFARWRRLALGFAAAAVLTATAPPAWAADHDRFATADLTVVTAKGRFLFTVEVAETGAQRQQGLQHRERLAAGAGMLFDYKGVRPVAMWMKNTIISLDMVFIDGAGRVVNVARNTVPLSLVTIPSAAPVRAVLEVNAGTARRLGIRPGDQVLHGIFGNAR